MGVGNQVGEGGGGAVGQGGGVRGLSVALWEFSMFKAVIRAAKRAVQS